MGQSLGHNDSLTFCRTGTVVVKILLVKEKSKFLPVWKRQPHKDISSKKRAILYNWWFCLLILNQCNNLTIYTWLLRTEPTPSFTFVFRVTWSDIGSRGHSPSEGFGVHRTEVRPLLTKKGRIPKTLVVEPWDIYSTETVGTMWKKLHLVLSITSRTTGDRIIDITSLPERLYWRSGSVFILF